MIQGLLNACTTYLASWESQNDFQNVNLDRVRKYLNKAPLSEIVETYNVLSTRKIWNTELTDAFIDALSYQFYETLTFCLDSCWFDSDWVNSPYAHLQLGVNEDFEIMDKFGESWSVHTGEQKCFVLDSNAFSKEVNDKLVRLILDVREQEKTFMVTIQVRGENSRESENFELQIIQIGSGTEAGAVSFLDIPLNLDDSGKLTELKDWGTTKYIVPAKVSESTDFWEMSNIYFQLKSRTYGIVDLDDNRLLLDEDDQHEYEYRLDEDADSEEEEE